MFEDLKSARLIILKAVLFFLLATGCSALLILQAASWQNAALLAVAVWSFCRLYYFAFYVMERYLDPNLRYSSLFALTIALLKRFKERDATNKHQR